MDTKKMADVSAEGGDVAGTGVPALWMQLEAVLGDKGKSIESRGDEIREAVVAFLRLAEEGKGTLSPAAESFHDAITGRRGRADSVPLSESGGVVDLLEAGQAGDFGRELADVTRKFENLQRRLGKLAGVAESGADFAAKVGGVKSAEHLSESRKFARKLITKGNVR